MKYLILFCIITLFYSVPNAEEMFPESRPVDQMTSYSSTDKNDWTGWNTFLFSAAIGGQTADLITTNQGLKSGCSEGNPVFGDDPSITALAGVKILALACAWYITEYVVEDKQVYRNWFYGLLAVAGFGAASWNAQQY